MTTATNGTGLKARDRYPCVVTTGEGWVEVQNTVSGGTLRLDLTTLAPADSGWVLANVAGAFPRTLRDLPHAVVARFAALAKGQGAATVAKAIESSARTSMDGATREVSGNGNTTEEQNVSKWARALEMLKGQKLFFVNYDIPVGADMDDPNGFFWQLGARYQWSMWIFREASLKDQRFTNWVAAARRHPPVEVRPGEFRRVKVDIWPQAEETKEAMLEEVRENLRQHLIKAHTSLVQRIANADETLKAARENANLTWQEVEAADKHRDGKVRGILRDAIKDVNDAVACARLFDDTDSVADLLAALRSAAQAQRTAFNALAASKGIKPAPRIP